jgi:hypothetical protein
MAMVVMVVMVVRCRLRHCGVVLSILLESGRIAVMPLSIQLKGYGAPNISV